MCRCVLGQVEEAGRGDREQALALRGRRDQAGHLAGEGGQETVRAGRGAVHRDGAHLEQLRGQPVQDGDARWASSSRCRAPRPVVALPGDVVGGLRADHPTLGVVDDPADHHPVAARPGARRRPAASRPGTREVGDPPPGDAGNPTPTRASRPSGRRPGAAGAVVDQPHPAAEVPGRSEQSAAPLTTDSTRSLWFGRTSSGPRRRSAVTPTTWSAVDVDRHRAHAQPGDPHGAVDRGERRRGDPRPAGRPAARTAGCSPRARSGRTAPPLVDVEEALAPGQRDLLATDGDPQRSIVGSWRSVHASWASICSLASGVRRPL